MRYILLIFLMFLSDLLFSQKIVSLLPSYTEIIYSLGAGENLIGVTNFCNYPDDAQKKTKVGDYLNPNIEIIYSLKPDIIFMQESKSESLKKIMGLKTRVVVLKPERNIEDIYKTIKIIGEYLKKEKEAEGIISRMRKELKVIKHKKKALKVYLELDKDGWSIGPDSFLSDVISIAGGENVFNDVKAGYFKAQWEEVVKRDPEFIILLNTEYNEFIKRPMADNIKAVKNKKILSLNHQDRDILARPSPRIVSIIKKLSEEFNK